ncbi:hypothetical protein D3C87_1664110 [compost metagenome]
MEQGRGLLCCLQHGRNIFFALFQRHHLGVDAVGRSALEDEIEKRVEFPIDLFDLGLSRLERGARIHAGLVHFPRKFLAKILEQFRFHQMLVEAVQHGGFKLVTTDISPVVAGALVAGVGAAKKVFGDHRIAATAAAALDKTCEEVFWPASVA